MGVFRVYLVVEALFVRYALRVKEVKIILVCLRLNSFLGVDISAHNLVLATADFFLPDQVVSTIVSWGWQGRDRLHLLGLDKLTGLLLLTTGFPTRLGICSVRSWLSHPNTEFCPTPSLSQFRTVHICLVITAALLLLPTALSPSLFWRQRGSLSLRRQGWRGLQTASCLVLT